MVVDVVIEIPYNSFIKYEEDESSGRMRCDRILNTSMIYPGNYGFVPNTLAGDGDPLDVLVVCDYALHPGIIISVKFIGVLLTKDEKGQDEKIIAVPSEKVDKRYSQINNISDLEPSIKSRIEHFFSHYKDNDPGKWVEVGEYSDREFALSVLEKSIENYERGECVSPSATAASQTTT